MSSNRSWRNRLLGFTCSWLVNFTVGFTVSPSRVPSIVAVVCAWSISSVCFVLAPCLDSERTCGLFRVIGPPNPIHRSRAQLRVGETNSRTFYQARSSSKGLLFGNNLCIGQDHYLHGFVAEFCSALFILFFYERMATSNNANLAAVLGDGEVC